MPPPQVYTAATEVRLFVPCETRLATPVNRRIPHLGDISRFRRQAGSLIDDRIDRKLVPLHDGQLGKVRNAKGKTLDPAESFVRWSVSLSGSRIPDTWSDHGLAAKRSEFDLLLRADRSLCIVSGEVVRTTQ
jgi:hypothetical protein